jgi:hypothetical protein
MDVAAVQGVQGIKIWLIEVQAFTRQLQKRMFQGLPLLPHERQGIMNFAAYWRTRMGAMPEAQVVLIALTEFAAM